MVSYVAYPYASVTDDDRRQWLLLVWPPITICRRASNNETKAVQIVSLLSDIGDQMEKV